MLEMFRTLIFDFTSNHERSAGGLPHGTRHSSALKSPTHLGEASVLKPRFVGKPGVLIRRARESEFRPASLAAASLVPQWPRTIQRFRQQHT
jgi:hypothetical protein